MNADDSRRSLPRCKHCGIRMSEGTMYRTCPALIVWGTPGPWDPCEKGAWDGPLPEDQPNEFTFVINGHESR